jgi:Short C-terminal domain
VQTPAAGDFDGRLRRLAKLKEDGMVTEEEFERKRAEILREKW